jgi:hypothetical protein
MVRPLGNTASVTPELQPSITTFKLAAIVDAIFVMKALVALPPPSVC